MQDLHMLAVVTKTLSDYCLQYLADVRRLRDALVARTLVYPFL